MLNPVLKMLALRPAALAEHAEAYAQLAAAEAGDALAAQLRLALLWASALCGLAVAAVLGGVAWMLAALQPATVAAPWPLWAAPAVPLLLALLALGAARRQQAAGPAPFAVLHAQWQIDRAWLRGDAPPAPSAAASTAAKAAAPPGDRA